MAGNNAIVLQTNGCMEILEDLPRWMSVVLRWLMMTKVLLSCTKVGG